MEGWVYMNILKALQKRGLSLPVPQWIFRLLMLTQAGVRGASLGVRIAVFDDEGRIFLVRHSYMTGWYLPGGGIERSEIPIDAVKRELAEEAKMDINKDEVHLLGVYLNEKIVVPDRVVVPDYVLLYQVECWRWLGENGLRPEAASDDGEIVAADFFSLDALPQDVSPATKRRLAEIQGKCAMDTLW